MNKTELKLSKQPYINTDIRYPNTYTSGARDKFDNEYQVIWKIINADCEDESEACDWDKFLVLDAGCKFNHEHFEINWYWDKENEIALTSYDIVWGRAIN